MTSGPRKVELKKMGSSWLLLPQSVWVAKEAQGQGEPWGQLESQKREA